MQKMSILNNWKQLQRSALMITANELPVLYQANGLLAIEKPYGIPVHSGPKTHQQSVSSLFPELERRLQLPLRSLALANRLDKNVSGVLLLTYEQQMANRVAELFRQRQIVKRYLAILVGHTKPSTGTLVSDIVEDKTAKYGHRRQKVVENLVTTKGPTATTEYKVLDNNKKTCMLCAFTTSTGYKHQIRVHAAQLLQSPILGDHKYNNHHMVGPQPLSLRMTQLLRMQGVKNETKTKGKIRPWQRGLVPLHLFAQQVILPGVGEDEGNVKIAASVPDYFLQTMSDCDLMFQRDEYEDKMLNQKKKKHAPTRDSVYISKGISPQSTSHVTSL